MCSPRFGYILISRSATATLAAWIHAGFALAQPVADIAQCRRLYRLGSQLQQQGRSLQALEVWQSLLLCAQQLGRLDLVQEALVAVQASVTQLNHTAQAALALSFEQTFNLANRLCLQEQPVLAQVMYQQALRQVDPHNRLRVGLCLSGLGMVHTQKRDYRRAETCCRAAARVLEQAGAGRHQAGAVHNLAMVYFYQHGDQASDQAIEYFQQALALWQQHFDPAGEGTTLLYLGRCYARQRQYMFALASYEAAASVLAEAPPEADLRWQVANLTEHLAHLYRESQHLDLAVDSYLNAVNLYQELSSPTDVAVMLQQLGQLHEGIGQVTMALHYYQEAQTLGVSPLAVAKAAKLREVR